jgi:hypothetical protein
MVPTLFYLLIFQGDRKVYISHEMKKQLFLLLFVLLVTGCSDDIPSSDYLGGDVKPKRLVSKIQQTHPDNQPGCRTWTFEYDDQNRIVKIDEKDLSDRPLNEPYYENITNITYNDNKIIQKTYEKWHWYEQPDTFHRYYYLNSDGNTEILSVFDMDNYKETKLNGPRSVAYLTYNKEGYLTYIDSENFDGENKTVYWKDGDIQQIRYNDKGPSVHWEYGEKINNPHTNIDFNYFLNSNELCRYFIDPDCLKAFGFFGKRGKYLKTKESYNVDSEKYILYKYILDEEGYVVKIMEIAEDGGNDYAYEIQYTNVK